MLSGRAKNLIVTEGGKNVFPEEIENEFQLYDDIEQITVQGYIDNRETRSESVEALVYPADCAYERIKGIRFNADDDKKVAARIKGYIDAVNKKLQPHARITKITMLQKPLEMTTTRKVKRIYKKS
jgi:long-chain acyl-CoA synthetase